LKLKKKETRCKYCDRKTDVEHRSYLANPFCADCLPQRLEASGAVDLRDNFRIVDVGNGYSAIIPIDETKLWKAAHRNE
jgi:hypothetical protein